jgi:hypothetical protein
MRLRIIGLTIAIDGCDKTAFRSFGVGLAWSPVMMTLADELVPDELWALVAPLLAVPPSLAVGRQAPCHPRPSPLHCDRVHGPHLNP